MIRLLIPIIFVIAAVTLFMSYTNPTYKNIKTLQVQENSFDGALSKAQELRKVRDELLAKRDSFNQAALGKLSHMLPDNVDNIRLIIDINNVASRHNLTLTNVDLGDLSQGQKQKTAAANSSDAVGNVVIGFSVLTSYDNFLAFANDLEHSLRLLDIQKVNFTASPSDAQVYSISIKTYWLH